MKVDTFDFFRNLQTKRITPYVDYPFDLHIFILCIKSLLFRF